MINVRSRSIAIIAIIGEISIIPILGVYFLKKLIIGSVMSRINKKKELLLLTFIQDITTRIIIAIDSNSSRIFINAITGFICVFIFEKF